MQACPVVGRVGLYGQNRSLGDTATPKDTTKHTPRCHANKKFEESGASGAHKAQMKILNIRNKSCFTVHCRRKSRKKELNKNTSLKWHSAICSF